MSNFRLATDTVDARPLLALINEARGRLEGLTPRRADLHTQYREVLDAPLLKQMLLKVRREGRREGGTEGGRWQRGAHASYSCTTLRTHARTHTHRQTRVHARTHTYTTCKDTHPHTPGTPGWRLTRQQRPRRRWRRRMRLPRPWRTWTCVCVCVCVCVFACVRARANASVCVCVCARARVKLCLYFKGHVRALHWKNLGH